MMAIAPLDSLHIFPCKWDKSPWVAGGFQSASNDPKVIALWRQQYFLFGAPTGAVNGFDVLDVDPGGQDWLAAYEATHGLPLTRIHATRRGGLHYFFQHRPGLKKSESLIAPNVDIRAEGAYCILWHLAGCRVLSNAPIAPWPGPMLQLLYEAMEAKGHTELKNNGVPLVVYRQTRQAANDQLPKPLYLKVCELMPDSRGIDRRRVIGALRDLVQLRDGRNKALLKTASFFRDVLVSTGVIDSAVAKELLFMAAQANGYVEKCGKDFALRTIKSAFKYKTFKEQTISDTPLFLWERQRPDE
jgi:hypothetical protein